LVAGLVSALAFPLAASESSSVREFVADARLGPALLLRSQSHALRYLWKPDLRLGARVAWNDRWEFGAALDALLDASAHYRVLGLMAHARFAPIRVASFSLGASAGLGAGYDADILHSSLVGTERVVPYEFLALDARWHIHRAFLGAEVAYQSFALVQAGVVV